jgi:alkylation response protein AidB-like acyl-CoA dehydrogenase
MHSVGGNEEQKQRAANIVIPGAHGCFSITEPGSGSDVVSIRTTARKDGDYYILNGSKCFATNGAYSDLYVIIATVDRSLGSKGSVAFMVEGGTPGLTVGNHENKMGLRLSNTCNLYLDDARVPAENLLGNVETASKSLWPVWIPGGYTTRRLPWASPKTPLRKALPTQR